MGFVNKIFGTGGDPDKAINEAQQQYQQYMQQAQNQLWQTGQYEKQYLYGGLQAGIGYETPFYQEGKEALAAYGNTLGLGGGAGTQSAIDTFRASPGYQFAMQQAQQATQRAATAGGMGGSGAEQKELARQAAGMADQEYSSYQQRLGALAGMGAQMGQTMAGQQIGVGTTAAELAGQLGSEYAGMTEQRGESASEAEMAKEAAREREHAAIWGNIGSLAGLGIAAYGAGMFGGGNSSQYGKGEVNKSAIEGGLGPYMPYPQYGGYGQGGNNYGGWM